MTQIILAIPPPFPSSDLIHSPIIQALHGIMINLGASARGPLEFSSFVQRPEGKLELEWRFKWMKSGNLQVSIRPIFSGQQGRNWRVDTQRGYVDLLRAISNCNREKSSCFFYMVSEYHYVEMVAFFSAQRIKKEAELRKYLRTTKEALNDGVNRLHMVIRPFLDPKYRSRPEDKMGPTVRNFLDKLILLAKYNHLRWPHPKKRMEANENLESRAEARLEEYRVEAVEKLNGCLKIMGTEEVSCLKEANRQLKFSEYSEWVNRNKEQHRVATFEKERNVFCVKILEHTVKSKIPVFGSHCKIQLGTYKLKMLISVNPQVNQVMRVKEAQQPILTETTQLVELAKKELKPPYKQQSKNSLQNELDFIFYIKQRTCRYVSTYYLEAKMKREKAEHVLMDYYPCSMREMLFREEKSLSTRQRITLLRKITVALNWLASNYICHRDLKPENVMLNQERVPKLIDFGSCCPASGCSNGHFKVTETRLLGTDQYFCPYPDSVKHIYTKSQYQQHILFDAFSLGRIIDDVFPWGLCRLMPNLESLMEYVRERCKEEDPANRLTYQELLFLFEKIGEHLRWIEGR